MEKQLTDEELLKIRKDWRRPELVRQHSPTSLKKSLEGMFTFTDLKYGDVKKGQGDIVIINCKVLPELAEHVNLKDYLSHTRFVDRTEEVGIFTNIFWSKEFFAESLKDIISTTKYVEI